MEPPASCTVAQSRLLPLFHKASPLQAAVIVPSLREIAAVAAHADSGNSCAGLIPTSTLGAHTLRNIIFARPAAYTSTTNVIKPSECGVNLNIRRGQSAHHAQTCTKFLGMTGLTTFRHVD